MDGLWIVKLHAKKSWNRARFDRVKERQKVEKVNFEDFRPQLPLRVDRLSKFNLSRGGDPRGYPSTPPIFVLEFDKKNSEKNVFFSNFWKFFFFEKF